MPWLFTGVCSFFFNSGTPLPEQPAELADLVSELQDVIDWKPFGLYLGIEISKLAAIEIDRQNIADCRFQLLSEWQKQVTPTWSAVIKALMEIGMGNLASKLAQKHG